MKKENLEKYLNKRVKIIVFNSDIIEGVFTLSPEAGKDYYKIKTDDDNSFYIKPQLIKEITLI